MLIAWCVRRFIKPMSVVGSYLLGTGMIFVITLAYLFWEGDTSLDMLLIGFLGTVLGFFVLYATRGIAGVKG